MIFAFIIWSIAAGIFGLIGFGCKNAKEAAGFFTFASPPTVTDVKKYNHAVAKLWGAAAAVLELLGFPFLFLEQNSPGFILILFGVMIEIITMMIVYLHIEAKYRKKE